MQRRSGRNLIITLAIIVLLAYICFSSSFFGLDLPGARDIRLGIDLNGGIDATLYAIKPDGSKPTQKELDTAKSIMNKRLDKLGILDREVATDANTGSIVLRIPWKPDETNFDPDTAIKEIGKTALLTFREVDLDKIDDNGFPLPTDRVIIQGTDVVDATAQSNPEGGMQVALKLSPEGKKKFAEATGRLIGQPIAIFMDDIFISAPFVKSHITTGDARITLGSVSSEEAIAEAKDLADTIRAGALPFKMEAKQVNSITPMLGKSALDVAINALIAAFILICLFMIFRYRLLGLLASIALFTHLVLQLLFISWLGITVTLSGMAGIILSIGMAVDANVVIYERIREELRSAKTLKASIDLGFKRAFTAILDSNITTLFAAVALYIFGTGTMVSFAYTLTIGVILSFLTAVFITRILVKSAAGFQFAKNPWYYGVKEEV
jgi:preprotein translocase subunit SecD